MNRRAGGRADRRTGRRVDGGGDRHRRIKCEHLLYETFFHSQYFYLAAIEIIFLAKIRSKVQMHFDEQLYFPSRPVICMTIHN